MWLHGKLVAVASGWLLKLFFLKSNDVLDAVLGTDLGEQRCFKFLLRQFVSKQNENNLFHDRSQTVRCLWFLWCEDLTCDWWQHNKHSRHILGVHANIMTAVIRWENFIMHDMNVRHRCSPKSVPEDRIQYIVRSSCSILERKVLEANATRRRPAFHVTTYHMKTIKNEQSWFFRFW